MSRLGTMLQVGRVFGMRHGMLRLAYEVERGSGLMSRRMKSAEGWQSWKLARIATGNSAEDLLSIRRNGGRPFFFSDPRQLAPALKQLLGAEREESLRAQAERILQGELPFFGRLSFQCGFPPNWFQNPQTRQSVSPSRPWTTMRFASPDYGDLKFILEPSRFVFVYPLARAYAISGDERLAEAFWSALEDWAEHSPPMSGPLWVCGQECSLRIMAWTFALYAFLHSAATTPQRLARLVSMIAAHAWRTEQTLGYARSQRSNHVISEAVGLWTVGVLYPELDHAQRWQTEGAKLLHEAVLDQITPAGNYLQDSFNYQRMVLHQLFWTLRLAEIYNVQLRSDIRSRAEAAFAFLRAFVDSPSGHMPNHGSNDGSHILPLTSCDYGDFRPLVQLGACVLNKQRALNAGPWDESARWLCGTLPASAEQPPAPTSLADTGYHRIGSQNSWALVRASSGQRRPFQTDQLHVDLWWRGLTLARDAGTYLYNGDPPWDNSLAATAVHNTVMVDGRDQMRRAGRFLWLDWSHATGQSTARAASYPDHFEGEHDGYRQLGIKHRRTVDCVKEDAWIIVDDLIGKEEHEVRIHWLLPDLPVEVVPQNHFSALLTSENARMHWNIFSSAPGSHAIVRGGKNRNSKEKIPNGEILGWESPTYGELRPAISLIYRVQAQLPVRFVTAIFTNDEFQLHHEAGCVAVHRNGRSLYKTEISPPEQPSGLRRMP